MEHQKIFATNIFILDNFIDETDTMKKYIADLWSSRDYDNNWQTKSADLQTKKEFKNFSDLIINTGKKICDTLGYDVEDLIITDMWANVLKQNGMGRQATAGLYSAGDSRPVVLLSSSCRPPSVLLSTCRPPADPADLGSNAANTPPRGAHICVHVAEYRCDPLRTA